MLLVQLVSLRRLNLHHYSCWHSPRCHQRMYVMDLPPPPPAEHLPRPEALAPAAAPAAAAAAAAAASAPAAPSPPPPPPWSRRIPRLYRVDDGTRFGPHKFRTVDEAWKLRGKDLGFDTGGARAPRRAAPRRASEPAAGGGAATHPRVRTCACVHVRGRLSPSPLRGRLSPSRPALTLVPPRRSAPPGLNLDTAIGLQLAVTSLQSLTRRAQNPVHPPCAAPRSRCGTARLAQVGARARLAAQFLSLPVGRDMMLWNIVVGAGGLYAIDQEGHAFEDGKIPWGERVRPRSRARRSHPGAFRAPCAARHARGRTVRVCAAGVAVLHLGARLLREGPRGALRAQAAHAAPRRVLRRAHARRALPRRRAAVPVPQRLQGQLPRVRATEEARRHVRGPRRLTRGSHTLGAGVQYGCV